MNYHLIPLINLIYIFDSLCLMALIYRVNSELFSLIAF